MSIAIGVDDLSGAWMIGPCPLCLELGLGDWQLDVLPAVRWELGPSGSRTRSRRRFGTHDPETHPGELELLAERIKAADAGAGAQPIPSEVVELGTCRVYWGSHGCDLDRGHKLPHVCGSRDEEHGVCSQATATAVRYNVGDAGEVTWSEPFPVELYGEDA